MVFSWLYILMSLLLITVGGVRLSLVFDKEYLTQILNYSLIPLAFSSSIIFWLKLPQVFKVPSIKKLEKDVTKTQCILDTISDAIIITNKDSEIVKVNDGVERVLGFSKDEILGNHISIIFSERSRQKQESFVRSYYENPKKYTFGISRDLFFICKDKKEIPVEITISPLDMQNGFHTISIIHDITEQYFTLEKLRESNRELDRFASIASHDLQEPLRVMTNYAQLLHRRYKNKMDKDAQDFIDYIVTGSERMKALIIDILSYSKIATSELLVETLNLDAILKEVLRDLESLIKENDAIIQIEEPLPSVMGDRVQLRQVLQNILANAIKYRGNDVPQIDISYSESPDNCEDWEIRISDNGIGIEEQYHEKIFLIFQRLHARSQYNGTGIGLAICRKVIERHSGKIWVESQLGKGSTFIFTLPKKETYEYRSKTNSQYSFSRRQ